MVHKVCDNISGSLTEVHAAGEMGKLFRKR